jgi:hypothetical protein
MANPFDWESLGEVGSMTFIVIGVNLFGLIVAWGGVALIAKEYGYDLFLDWSLVAGSQADWGWIIALVLGHRYWQHGKFIRLRTALKAESQSLVRNPESRAPDDAEWPAAIWQVTGFVLMLVGVLALATLLGNPDWLLWIAIGMLLFGAWNLLVWMRNG